ncbi:cystatin-M [Nycticebus coucang]|uniref:cystatin-M n=1 Tax=Nycticebus coucang TaxID=9470 RepID=UPI00234C7609|nr:cystatin-M [Nycticebus coucang]
MGGGAGEALTGPAPALAWGRTMVGRSCREPVKAAQAQGLALLAMARPRLLLVLCLSLVTLCLLELPCNFMVQGDRQVGERVDMSPSDPQVQKVTQMAVATYNRGSNSAYYFRDTDIIKAQRQLVAGIQYFLTVLMGSTSCRKNTVTEDRIATCPLAVDAQQEKLRCDFVILVVPWKNSSELLKSKCSQM